MKLTKFFLVSFRMSWTIVVRSHQCPLEWQCNISILSPLWISQIRGFQFLLVHLPQILGREFVLSSVIISRRIQSSQMLCRALFARVFSTITFLTQALACHLEMEPETMNPPFFNRTGMLILRIPTTLRWICMQIVLVTTESGLMAHPSNLCHGAVKSWKKHYNTKLLFGPISVREEGATWKW